MNQAPRVPRLIAVMGPTACGKTAFAERLAERMSAAMINADAFQVYRGMDIGTAKPHDRSRYHLLDIREPDEQFGVGEFVALARELLQLEFDRGRSCVVVGGTGLYVRALFENYQDMKPPPGAELRSDLNRMLNERGIAALRQELQDRDPEAYAIVDLQNPRRVLRALERAFATPHATESVLPPFARTKIGLDANAEALATSIEVRTREMVQNGWIREVESLRRRGYRSDDPGFRALGYREMWLASSGQMDLEEAIAQTIVLTKRYAKRQRTWLRKEPNLVRLEAPDTESLDKTIDEIGDLHWE